MSVLFFAEQRAGSLRAVALEVATAGRRLADAWGTELIGVLLGPPGIEEAAADLARHGADSVLIGASDEFGHYAPESYTRLLARACEERSPRAVLFAATAQGKDLGPRVAARIGAALATEVIEIDAKDGELTVVRPVYAGKAFARVRFSGEPALMSLRARAFTPEEDPRDPRIEELAPDAGDGGPRTRVRFEAEEEKERPDVAEAEIVVSGGRGMGGPENWQLLEDLADALGSAAALGASRAVVDSGWRPHPEQVGQTGKVVAPKLYFAIGISGAIQHQAGMRTAHCIVAINKDREAPIFELANYGIVGDLFEVVPRLTEEIRKLRTEG